MIHKILSLFALLSVSFVSSQTIPKTENICFFQDAKSGKPITIVNDSLIYNGELKNPSILKHTNYPGNIKDYTYHFNIKKHTYLVHAGCGPVLEFRNDSIVRIDNSFLQQNQYGASPFIYEDQICLFGGYGLFTTKNIITRFDIKAKEWFRVYNKENENLSERSDAISFYNTKGLFLFGGWTNINTIQNSFQEDPKLSYLDYSNLTFESKGNYNKNIVNLISNSNDNSFTFQTDKILLLFKGENIITIDFITNNVTYFENKKIYEKPIGFYFDSYSNSLVYLKVFSGVNNVKLERISLTQLLKTPIKTEKLYYMPWQEYLLSSFWILFVLILFYLIYRRIIHKKGKHFVYYQSRNKFYYKSKIISNLDTLEEKIMCHLFQNNKSFIQLNQLNFIFEKENQDNFTNVIKKRDLVLSSLLVKLNAFVIHGAKPLVIIQKNEVDKRIKEIKLNPLYFTLK